MIKWLKKLFKKKHVINLDAMFEEYENRVKYGDEKKAHLVISGSGAKLVAFLMSLYVLHLLGYIFTRVTGTSGGAILAGAIATFYDPSSSREERGRSLRKVIRLTVGIDIPSMLDPQWRISRIAFGKSGMIKGNKLLKKFKKELAPKFESLKMPCEIVTFQTNLVDPRTRVLTSGNLPEAIRASMSIPFLFSPVRRGKMLLVDGGFQMNLPIPDGGQDVVALTFSTGDNDAIEEAENNIEQGFKLIDGAIAEGMRRAAEDAPDAKIFKLSTEIGSLSFFMSEEEKERGLRDGAESVMEAV